jgi:predicted GH43/DUF377 family glycosyl hydrolase
MSAEPTAAVVTRADLTLTADPSRVVAQLFVPGQELALDHESRTSNVLGRILSLPEETVVATLESVIADFSGRHRNLRQILQTHFDRVAHRVPTVALLTEARRLLIGACFTKEYAVEAAALFNPSVVPHPDQSGLPAGAVRFVMSLRAVGEGHISSIEFRTGVAGPGQTLTLDAPGRFLDAGQHRATVYDRALFLGKLTEAGADGESASFLLQQLPARFDDETLRSALSQASHRSMAWHGGTHTAELARWIAACNYDLDFDASSPLAERILWPHAPSESQGMEDARFVRFVGDDGAATYYGTYTAYNGDQVAPQLIETADFEHFRISQLSGPSARNKGMALFPRKVNGSFVALSRWDRESTAIATSADGRLWGAPITLHSPRQPWEIIQLGNAGSPIETAAGWLVITHGVGPMREYSLGAILLDLDDPTTVIGALREPLMRPRADERDGYVPNVLYSCGAMVVGDQLLLPFGVADSSVRFAFVDLPGLLKRLTLAGPVAPEERGRITAG